MSDLLLWFTKQILLDFKGFEALDCIRLIHKSGNNSWVNNKVIRSTQSATPLFIEQYFSQLQNEL